MKKYIKSATVDIFSEPTESRVRIAQDPNTRPSVLKKLTEDEDNYVIAQVAQNPNTPVDILRKLFYTRPNSMSRVSSEDVWLKYIRRYLIKNPNLPEDLVVEMYATKSAYNSECFREIYAHPNFPIDLMREFVNKGDLLDMEHIAANPSIPADVISALLSADNDYFDIALLNNPGVPKDIKDHIADNYDLDTVFTTHFDFDALEFEYEDINQDIKSLVISNGAEFEYFIDEDENDMDTVYARIMCGYIPDAKVCDAIAQGIYNILRGYGYSPSEVKCRHE